jgi:hypothetical protein
VEEVPVVESEAKVDVKSGLTGACSGAREPVFGVTLVLCRAPADAWR